MTSFSVATDPKTWFDPSQFNSQAYAERLLEVCEATWREVEMLRQVRDQLRAELAALTRGEVAIRAVIELLAKERNALRAVLDGQAARL